MTAAPGLTARSLGDLDDGPLRAVVAAWAVRLGRGSWRANLGEKLKCGKLTRLRVASARQEAEMELAGAQDGANC